MEKYKPPFTITNQILSYVSSISEKIGRITATSSLEAKPHLRRNNKIKSIHSSLKIEANSLTLGQVRDVINGKVVLGEQKEIQEVKNAYAAYERLSEIDPYDMRYLKRFHGMMTKYLVEESGEFRSGEEGVFNGGLLFVRGQQRGAPAVHEIFHVAVGAVDGGDDQPAQVQMVFRRRVRQAVQQRRQDGGILNDAVLAKRPLQTAA